MEIVKDFIFLVSNITADGDCSLQGNPSMGFSRQEYWSGLPFPSPGDLPNPGIQPESPALAGRFLATEPPGLGLNISNTELHGYHMQEKGIRLTATLMQKKKITFFWGKR